ncbi:hypothetical protein B0H14DRAFT_3429578 [Mycena olivaceomarginata]|nr:hypothetical protein B0H14DRAFT_3429578 [Mycena olivaceomarginata]
MSKSSTPTLPWVLPMYEKMLVNLRSTRDDEKILRPLRVTVSAGLEKLETYYSKACACQFNVIAIGIQETYDDKKAASRAQTGNSNVQARPGASASFLDDICMFDAEDKTPPTGGISELDQFFSAFQTYGQGIMTEFCYGGR